MAGDFPLYGNAGTWPRLHDERKVCTGFWTFNV